MNRQLFEGKRLRLYWGPLLSISEVCLADSWTQEYMKDNQFMYFIIVVKLILETIWSLVTKARWMVFSNLRSYAILIGALAVPKLDLRGRMDC
jgi:hypothetical protein